MSKRWRLRPSGWAVLLSVTGLFVALAWAAAPRGPAALPMAAMLPQGALMTVESADFGSLVDAWNQSPEQHAWLQSASYVGFAHSRLFALLQNAQNAFSNAARSSVDGRFLANVAGKESIFAWYDIGNLQFLYISRLPQARLTKLGLLAQRGSFARREVDGSTFYVRTTPGDAASEPAEGRESMDAEGTPAGAGSEQARTVAFAVEGDLLLIATREDLIASALQLIHAGRKGNPIATEATEGWYAAATAAGSPDHGDLHMLLDLQRLTKTPQFRTYWSQRNVTETRKYRAAVVDLYREPGQFREERVLLPMQPGDAGAEQSDLGSMESLVPERAGVYRAVAHPPSANALNALLTKVLVRQPAVVAKDDALSPQMPAPADSAGQQGDFDTRINTPQRPSADSGEQLAPLQNVLKQVPIESMLTVDRSDSPAQGDGFVRIQSAVVLRSAGAWDENALAAAVLATVRPRLTTASLGLNWTPTRIAGREYLKLSYAEPICLSVQGPLAFISTSPALMEDLLSAPTGAHVSTLQARELAGFRHDEERSNFHRLTAELNASQSESDGAARDGTADADPNPSRLFRDNLPSLSTSFAALNSQHFAETSDADKVHQTVVYRWGAR